MPSEARMAALRAMANQSASPEEAVIARAKLSRYASFTTYVETLAQQMVREVREAHEREEAARLLLLRKFERGQFRGVTIRAGAGAVEARYR